MRVDCTDLLLSLERGQENRHKKQLSSPALLGTILPLDEILEVVTRQEDVLEKLPQYSTTVDDERMKWP